MSSISNSNGRALEYIVTKTLVEKYNCQLNDSCKYMQLKDEVFYLALPENQQRRYQAASNKIGEYLETQYDIQDNIIIRLTDDQAKSHNSDVTDICLLNGENSINISLKNNHSAVKHNRPSALALQCGFGAKSIQDIEYRENYKDITDSFTNLVNKNFTGLTLFNEVKSQDKDFINLHLYKPVCQNVVDFINKYVKLSPPNSSFLFSFLIGSKDFIKIVLRNNLEITNFYKIAQPTSVNAILKNDSYVFLNFNNGYVISMRLHTASSKVKGVSLKFDSQVVTSDLTPVLIDI